MNNQKVPLKALNTLGVDCNADNYFIVDDSDKLIQLSNTYSLQLAEKKFYLLGDGSNTLFTNETTHLIIKSDLKGISIKESEDAFIVEVAAGENWHEFVVLCLEQNIYGLENLALIPGSVGAAPVQNIGAYGVEFSKYCLEVHWFDFKNKKIRILTKECCKFGYRDSIFKQELKNKGMITNVVFSFPKKWQPCLSYQGLTELAHSSSPKQVMERVIYLRKSKLPDPDKLPNAGSFFKNPIITKSYLDFLLIEYPNMPFYPQVNGDIKLAAGWLIEKVGLKGKKLHNVSVHEKQALVLVNHNYGSGQQLINLAKLVQHTVFEKFQINLIPEVRFVGANGECDAEQCLKTGLLI